MFGLGKDDMHKQFFTYDLEKKLQDPTQKEAIEKDIENKIHAIKKLLKAGVNDQEFETWGHILQGYYSLLKTVGVMVHNKQSKRG